MQFIGIVKRVVPFFLTFAAGLFIASLFFPLSVPNFEGVRNARSERHGKRHCKSENERLRAENERLKRDLKEALELKVNVDLDDFEINVPSPPPPPPAPVKEMKMKTVTVK